ncbi:hypothetical protein BH11CYA1_BH11CYA1_06600 [soil metagenome]
MNKTPDPRRMPALLRLTLVTLTMIFSLILLFSWLGFANSAGEYGRAFRRAISTKTGFCLTCKLNDIDPKLPFVKALQSDSIDNELVIKASAYGEANGIQILLQGNQFEYTLYAAGERLVLFKTAATAEGLALAPDLLNTLVDQKIDQLNKSAHRASFSQNNEVVEKQSELVKGKLEVNSHVILARKPRLNELYGIEAALASSLPSNLAPGSKFGIKFYFLQEQLYKDSKDGAAYYVFKDKDSRASIYITPGSLDKLWPTEADAPAWAVKQRTIKGGVFYDTIESLMMHELAHNHQGRMGWDDSDKKKLSEMAALTGFAMFREDDGSTVFFIKVKVSSSTTDGQNYDTIEFYRLEGGLDHTAGKHWLRVSDKGQWLTENGLPAPTADAAKVLDNAQVKAAAVVTPASNYFDSPAEVEAEAMKLYRLGGASRNLLLLTAPTLYRLVESEDQSEINARFGSVSVKEERTLLAPTEETTIDSQSPSNNKATTIEAAIKAHERLEPLYIRTWSGKIVPYSSAIAREIFSQEVLTIKAGE